MESFSPVASLVDAVRSFFKRFAVVFKLAGILFLVLLLQIPLAMVGGLLNERLSRREAAVGEITETWGRAQTLVGPVLVVPYRLSYTTETPVLVNGRAVQTTVEKVRDAFAYFLPEELAIEGQVDPSRRHRGIYEAVVYSGHLKLSGKFAPPDYRTLGIAADLLEWDRAKVVFAMTDLRGAREALTLSWGGQSIRLVPGTGVEGMGAGLHADVAAGALAKSAVPFSLDVMLNGSESLSFAPLGAQTRAKLQSSWPDPSFRGAFPPSEREVGPAGFTALWNISYYGRDFPQQWVNRSDHPLLEMAPLQAAGFGVGLVTPVDSYRAVERATKYGALFITLLFTAFFLFEILAALRLHVLHYLLVGAALCLFYLGLLSLSEFVAFGVAYLSASAASTALVVLYCRSVLRGWGRSLAIGCALTGIYAYLYFVLQMQDYALLAGSGVLFAVLAVVMFATRRIDWSRSDSSALAEGSAL